MERKKLLSTNVKKLVGFFLKKKCVDDLSIFLYRVIMVQNFVLLRDSKITVKTSNFNIITRRVLQFVFY